MTDFPPSSPPPPPVPPIPEAQLTPDLEHVPWRAREALLIALLAFFTGGLVSLVIVSAVRDENLQVLLATVTLEASLGLWVWLWVKLRYRVGLGALGLKYRRGDLGAGALAALLGLGVGAVITQVVLSLAQDVAGRPVEPPQQLPEIERGPEIVLAGIAVVIIAPIAEELFFRGFIYQAFRRWRGVTQGMLLSAAVFAIAHISLIIVPSIFALGVILAYLFERRGSLAATMAAHIFYNAIGFTLIVGVGS
jgi:membrane protease YdiL (CAAX protease family)